MMVAVEEGKSQEDCKSRGRPSLVRDPRQDRQYTEAGEQSQQAMRSAVIVVAFTTSLRSCCQRVQACNGAVLYTRRVLLEHTWILFCSFREDAPPRCQRWAGALLGRLSAYITLVTILAAFMFLTMDGVNQSGQGKGITDASVMTPIYGTPMCQWDSFAQACYFGQPEVDLFQVLLYVFIISVITAPLVKLQEYFVLEATQQAWFHVSPFRH